MTCKNCNGQTKIIADKYKKEGFFFRCTLCQKKMTAKASVNIYCPDTLNLQSLGKVIFYMFIGGENASEAAKLLKRNHDIDISRQSITKIYQELRKRISGLTQYRQ